MKRIDIIRPGSINAIIGPVGTLKRMLSHKAYFNERGFDLSVFTDDSVVHGAIRENPSDEAVRSTFNTRSLIWRIRHRIGNVLRALAKNWNIFAILLLEKQNRSCKKLVKYYLNQNRKADIVQFHSFMEAYYYLKYRQDSQAKVIMFLHTDGDPFKMTLIYYPRLAHSWYFKRYMRIHDWTVEHVDCVGFIAKIAQRNFLSLYPFLNENNTCVILNGIDDLNVTQKNIFQEIRSQVQPFRYRLCCTGTINIRKGHRLIIEALNKLPKEKLMTIHVDFLGEGAERPLLETLVNTYGLSANVTFHGIVPNVDVYKYLAASNIYILMSYNEGLPISIIEAMRAQLMIISTNVSGIPETVENGYNGFLLNPDADELAALLKRLDTIDIHQMGQNSRKRYEEEFTFNRMAKEFCDLYDK